jgi:hypothetical protein
MNAEVNDGGVGEEKHRHSCVSIIQKSLLQKLISWCLGADKYFRHKVDILQVSTFAGYTETSPRPPITPIPMFHNDP